MSNIGMRYGGLGYMQYGQPATVVSAGRSSPYQSIAGGALGNPVITEPLSGRMPPLTLSWNRMQPGVYPHAVRPVDVRVAAGGGFRSILRGVWGKMRPGVLASTPTTAAIGVGPQGAVDNRIVYSTPGPNSNTALFGRPGFQYSYSRPAVRMGPNLKGSTGTGRTNTKGPRDNRSLGFQPTGYGTQQFMPMTQFDYTPATDPTFDVGSDPMKKFATLPRTIRVGSDGYELVGTYRAHDNTQADRFFKQGRSASNWQDMSFGPNYRYLLPWQQVARYNLYNDIALARPLAPNNYFLGYTTQPATAAQLGGALGMGRPLGY